MKKKTNLISAHFQNGTNKILISYELFPNSGTDGHFFYEEKIGDVPVNLLQLVFII